MEIVNAWITALVAVLALVASVVFGVLNTMQARESARQAKRSADSSEKSLEMTRTQLETSTTAQAESLRLAQLQLENAVRAHQDSTQPYVWADLRPREDGGILQFVVGNAGPTVATDVHIKFEPPLNHVVPQDRIEYSRKIEKLFEEGVKSLPPGRVFAWNLGVGSDFFRQSEEAPPVLELAVTITATGPHGPVPVTRYSISLDDLRYQAARPHGLGLIEVPLGDVAKQLKVIGSALKDR